MTPIELSAAGHATRRGGGVRDVTLSVEPGERVAVFGGAGSGKSTLLRLLAGEVQVTAGLARVLGRPPVEARRWLGYVPQEGEPPGRTTLRKAITEQFARHRKPEGEKGARLGRLMELLEALDLAALQDLPARELSAGERAATELAVALCWQPRLLLVDGIDAHLAEPVRARFWNHVDQLRQEGALTVVHATTHSETAEAADRVLLLHDGSPLACAPPDDLLREHAADEVTVEAADPEIVSKTLRGIYDVRITERGREARFQANDGAAAAAHLFRHPGGGVRVVTVRHPTLWDVRDALIRILSIHKEAL
jgi:ABC-type multidrug transport system ATPase subunit